MLEAAEIRPDDVIVEVGPGFGVLTLALAEKVNKVLSFEIEKKLELYWNEIIENRKLRNLEIVWGNVLKFPNFQFPISNYKVIANLPYQITSNVIRKFLEAEHKPELMVLMVQKEVAERICAKPGDMSVLAISVQCYADPEIVMHVPKSYFWPVPGVDSAIIKLRLKTSVCHSERSEESLSQSPNGQRSFVNTQDDKCVDQTFFFKIVKAGFASRRKMLIKNLGALTDKKKLPIIFHELGINEKARAQELSVEQWISLAGKL